MPLTNYLTVRPISHGRRVCALYKGAVRNIEARFNPRSRWDFRYQCQLLRARFDAHTSEVDARKAKMLLIEGEKELELKLERIIPIKFPYCPGGVAYQRILTKSDDMLDKWHPLEKAQYPEYFALREIRKKEFVERWETKYGTPTPETVERIIMGDS